MNYSKLAHSYHSLERCTMGRSLQSARTGQLDRLCELTTVRRALIVGEGNGSFLLSFARKFPDTQITVVEPSEGMIQLASRRLEAAGLASKRINFIQMDISEAVFPAGHFDLIVTHFFFDGFESAEVGKLILQLEGHAKDGAYWLLSDFCIPERGWRKWRAQFWLYVLYRFFGLTTGLTVRELPAIEALMEESLFTRIDRQSYCGEMLYSSLYQQV